MVGLVIELKGREARSGRSQKQIKERIQSYCHEKH